MDNLPIPKIDEATLDDHVRFYSEQGSLLFDVLGDSLQDAQFARTRISPLYKSALGLFGYLEISRMKLDEDSAKLVGDNGFIYQMGGIIMVPGSIIGKLKSNEDQRIYDKFSTDFEIQGDESLDIAPLFGIDLPEKEYYWSTHPKYHDMPKQAPEFEDRFHLDIMILTGYLSKMDQWIAHAQKGLMGKEKIPYEGLATEVGSKRYETKKIE